MSLITTQSDASMTWQRHFSLPMLLTITPTSKIYYYISEGEIDACETVLRMKKSNPQMVNHFSFCTRAKTDKKQYINSTDGSPEKY